MYPNSLEGQNILKKTLFKASTYLHLDLCLSEIFFLFLLKDHRPIEDRKDFWRSSGPKPLIKQARNTQSRVPRTMSR